MKLKPSMRHVAILAVLCLLSVGMSGCASIQSGYEFKSGQVHPQQISDLIRNGTVLLFITKNDCPYCEAMKPKIASLQSQLNGTNFTLQGTSVTKQSTNVTKQSTNVTKSSNLTFIRVNINDNVQSSAIGQQYSATDLPTIIVIRADGAVAVFKGETDANLIKSAIEDAQKWK